ncbi:MAG: hypothetical protein JWM28_1264 [Chitinophagaceae bacterium]|nr:hypothetical protein [Chitinophagaceae bacterium]
MKQLLILVLAITTLTVAACAQKLDASKVPAAVKTAFAKQYPGVTAKWEKEKSNYEAGFKQNGTSISVLYDANGTMTESETDIKISDLPPTVLAYVKEHYKGKSIKEGAKITKADGTVNYEAEVNGKDVMFDADGKFLKEVKD